MMTNLFSVFDPCTGFFSLNWLSAGMFMIIMPYSFWILPNKLTLLNNKILNLISKEMLSLMKYKGNNLIMMSLFMFILVNNTMGLLPYVFTSPSHLTFSLTLALPFWLSFMIYGWMNKTNKMFSHLVPVGTPGILMPFMVVIETISNLIRPGSLAVRLTANMIAGHLLMSLLGNSMNNIYLIFMLMMVLMVLMMFELAVSIIQSYVFLTLTTLYSSEI
uniref:ATP synthase subunit a n=1 Tax=Processina sexmaculata TaxID=2906307 RepID=A0A977XUN4_9HEMI|nr:ATP synthase F0 subunit 6 [Processina sexmaculata]UXX17583.1 ATP synthase F0 subunit 6 [Processina sexmaculata]